MAADFLELREAVLVANAALPGHGLVKLTSGNVSEIDRSAGVMAIKPSGLGYAAMSVDDIVVVDVDSGEVLFGSRRPSSDTPTHLVMYRAFERIGGIVHTHSMHATAWAQAGREIPVLGTTHADLTPWPIPVTRELTAEEVAAGYEESTGAVLAETIAERGPVEMPCVLLRGHAPFCWGASAASAVENAVWLEEVARMALLSRQIDPASPALSDAVRDKHFERKHGPGAYYGQA
jgi:L-ribulose-5-phosphate 4-epimerase